MAKAKSDAVDIIFITNEITKDIPKLIKKTRLRTFNTFLLSAFLVHANIVKFSALNKTGIIKKEHIKTIIKEQRDSLDNWLNYFLSKDSDYLPMWAKVWAFQGMLQIGNLNKDKDGYDKRSKT